MTEDVRTGQLNGLNTVDMDESGDRRGPLWPYGNPYGLETLRVIFQAWNVKAHWLVNPTGLSAKDGVPSITNDGGPAYMLLFPDGKWRYAKFGGINGPPWYYCPFAGWEAPTGEAAWLMSRLEQKIKHREHLDGQVLEAANEIAELKQQLAAAMKKPKEQEAKS